MKPKKKQPIQGACERHSKNGVDNNNSSRVFSLVSLFLSLSLYSINEAKAAATSPETPVTVALPDHRFPAEFDLRCGVFVAALGSAFGSVALGNETFLSN